MSASVVGCVDGFRGANVQVDLSPGTPAQAHYATTQSGGPAPLMTEVPANTHYTLFAIQQGAMSDHLFAIQDFEIHHIVDLTSPCFIDVGDHVPYPGIHVSQYANRVAQDTKITDPANPPPTATDEQKIQYATAQQRMLNVDALAGITSPLGVSAVVSASAAGYPPIAADCNGAADQIPPPQCFDDASNARRLKLCQDTWRVDPTLFEGSDRVLTEPLHGTTYGLVDGENPISHGPVGGAQFFVDNALTRIDAYAIYVMPDGGPTTPTGQPLYFGKPTMPTRGVLHVHLVNPENAALTSEMAVSPDLGHDDVHF